MSIERKEISTGFLLSLESKIGTATSGNYGHAGRPGQEGGSAPRSSSGKLDPASPAASKRVKQAAKAIGAGLKEMAVDVLESQEGRDPSGGKFVNFHCRWDNAGFEVRVTPEDVVVSAEVYGKLHPLKRFDISHPVTFLVTRILDLVTWGAKPKPYPGRNKKKS